MKQLLLSWDQLERNESNGEKDIWVIHRKPDKTWEYIVTVDSVTEIPEISKLNGYDRDDMAIIPNTIYGAYVVIKLTALYKELTHSDEQMFEMNYLNEGIRRGYLSKKFRKYASLAS